MTKVVINKCWGGFTLTKKAIDWLEERGVFNTPQLQKELLCYKQWVKETMCDTNPGDFGILRDNPLLVECVETLGQDAYKRGISNLVVEERDGTLDKDFFIGDYDGYEEIFESEKEAVEYNNQP